MSLPPQIGIEDKEFQTLYQSLDFVQRQIYTVSSGVCGGLIGGLIGIASGAVFSLFRGNFYDNMVIGISIGTVWGAYFIGLMCSLGFKFDILAYVSQSVVLTVIFALFLKWPFSTVTALITVISPVLAVYIVNFKVFVRLQISILNSIQKFIPFHPAQKG